jgi:hypothetical protein
MSEQAKRVLDYEAALAETCSCYYRNEVHGWYLLLADPIAGTLLAWLANHDVVEHEDGSISATPSIKVSDYRVTRHGYLTRGVWTEC